MMKKILTAAIAALLLVSLASCAFAATGIGSTTTVTSTPATAEAAAKVSVTTTMCAVTLDENGVIVGIQFDAVQPKSDWENATVEPQTKKELKEGYGMKKASAIGKEWYEQAEALEAWCIGKTVEQVLAMGVNESGYPTDADVTAGCTMGVSGYLAALEKAAAAAK